MLSFVAILIYLLGLLSTAARVGILPEDQVYGSRMMTWLLWPIHLAITIASFLYHVDWYTAVTGLYDSFNFYESIRAHNNEAF